MQIRAKVKRSRLLGTSENLILAQKVTCQIMDSSSLTFLMHGYVRKMLLKDAFDMHFWRHNAWQHCTISTETRRKFLRHDFSVYF